MASKVQVWMPWYLTDYMRDTMELSLEEDAVYRRALDFLWLNPAGLPRVSSRLARCLRITEDELSRCKWVFDQFLQVDGDYYRSKRIDEEYEKALLRRCIAQQNGKNGGRPKNPVGNPAGNPEHNLNPNPEKSSSPSPSPSPSTSTSEKKYSYSGFIRPSLEEVQDYCAKRGNEVDPQAFLNHYDSNGWKVGKNSMKDWQASVRTWEKNKFEKKQGNGPETGIGRFKSLMISGGDFESH